MASTGLMQEISRQQKRKYLSSLRAKPERRVEARHRYLMLKEMPYRDSSGRALTLFHLTSFQPQHLHPRHSRPLHPKSHHLSSHVSLLCSPSPTHYSDFKLPANPLSRHRSRKLDNLINRCETSLSSSPEKSHRRRESMPAFL